MENKKIKATWTPELAQDLAALHNETVDNMFNTLAEREFAQDINSFKPKFYIMKVKEWLHYKNRKFIPAPIPMYGLDLNIEPDASLPKGLLFYIDAVWDEKTGELKMVTKSKMVDVSRPERP